MNDRYKQISGDMCRSRDGGNNQYTIISSSVDLFMCVSTGGSVTSSLGGMAMGEHLLLLRCRRTQTRALGWLTHTDRDALLRRMPTTPLLEAMVATGQTTWTPPTTSATTADPTCSPKITKSGLPSTSLAQPTRLRSSRKYPQEARPQDFSSTRRDPTTPCLLPSVQESMLTTSSATVMYAAFVILSMLAGDQLLKDSIRSTYIRDFAYSTASWGDFCLKLSHMETNSESTHTGVKLLFRNLRNCCITVQFRQCWAGGIDFWFPFLIYTCGVYMSNQRFNNWVWDTEISFSALWVTLSHQDY